MITGWFPLVCLWLTWTGYALALGLHLSTHWRANQVSRHLAAFVGVPVLWWGLVLVGSYLPGYPVWLQVIQAGAFALIPVVVWGLVVLMVRARRGHLLPHKPRHSNAESLDEEGNAP